MVIGKRLRTFHEGKKFSQGELAERTRLLGHYVSRVENGHTVPSIQTLEKFARAFGIPMYQLFYDGEEPPKVPNLPKRKSADEIPWGSTVKDARWLHKLRRLLSLTEDSNRKILMSMAEKMAKRKAV